MPKLKYLLIMIVATPFFCMVIWYCVSFLPYIGDLNRAKERGQIDLLKIEEDVQLLAEFTYTSENLRMHAIDRVFWIESNQKGHGIFTRLTALLWYYASYLHFDDKEIIYIWAVHTPYENGTGLANASYYYYKKSINKLDKKELISIIALIKSPSKYQIGGKLLNERVNTILDLTKDK